MKSFSIGIFLFIQIILCSVLVVVQSLQKPNNRRRQQQPHYHQHHQQEQQPYGHDITYGEHNKQIDDKFLFDSEATEAAEQLPLYLKNAEMDDQPQPPQPTIEIDINGKCQQGCVCQYAHFKDLPTSRWINYMQRPYQIKMAAAANDKRDWSINNYNIFEHLDDNSINDLNYLMNSHIKQATCIIQDDTNVSHLINALPHNIQALILLYTGVHRNKSVNASALKPLNQLTTLELRGSEQGYMHFIMDVPLNFIQHANFEFITLMGSDTFKTPSNIIHPKDMFDYKPNIELLNDLDISDETFTVATEGINKAEIQQYDDQKLLINFEEAERSVELDIIPYEIYREEVKKARMPTFYGWQNLEVLRIHSCGFDELSWEMFFDLPNLQYLSLERNGIKVVPPFAFSGATQLKTLSLAHNLIKDLHYRDLAGLFKLRLLNLSDNRLNKLTEFTFPPLPQLQWIDFRENPIHHIFPATFWIMNQTQVMWLGSKEVALELWGNMPFKMLHRLKFLHIGNVSINNLDNNIFKDLHALEILEVHGDIRFLEFDAFSDLYRLRELDMSHSQLREISMDALIGCKQLRIINFSFNNLTFIPPGLFDDQALLEEIYLDSNQLVTLAKNFFLQRKLKLARLNNNPWKCSCDMMNWKAKITNQERGPHTERCISDYLTGRNVSCWKLDGFKFNRKYTPRCSNFKGRSVYYVLRKQLSCGPQKFRNHINDSLAYWQKVENYNPAFNNKNNKMHNRLSWQLKRSEKLRHSLKNTTNNRNKSQENKHGIYNNNASMKWEHENEMSNNI